MRREEESTGNDNEKLLASFLAAVSTLSQGELNFPAPFDYPSSVALADNDDVGQLAQSLFELAASRDCQYRVGIFALSAQHPDMRREIIGTTVASTGTLIALLEGFLEELYQRHAIE